MAVTLVSAIIDKDGQPLFADNTDTYVTALEENQPTRDRVLNAVTALLVRNHEIVATAVDPSYQQVLAVQQSGNLKQPEDPSPGTEVWSDSDDAGESHPSDSRTTGGRCARFTAVTNPQHKSNFQSTGNYMVAGRGTSHMAKFGNWEQLLNIS